MFQPRSITATVREALQNFAAVLLTGPRQSGKTTLLRELLADQAAYISFDDPLERAFALQDPVGFLDRYAGRPVILDEIQYAADLLPYLKLRIDQAPARKGQWILTGSQQFALMRGVSESLAGRVAVLELPPFSQLEWPRSDLPKLLWEGGYPSVALNPKLRDLWLRSYVATYIERDVRQIRQIPDLRTFNQFIHLAAARQAQAFHPADFARDLGLSQPTVKAWSGVLEAAYLTYALPAWSRNYGKRVVKASKLYFLDTALVSLLTRQPDAASALAGPLGGPLFEGWVVSEALKAFMALGRQADLSYWRSHDGLEVDLLIGLGARQQAVEIKLTATPAVGHLTPLSRWLAVAGADAWPQGLLVCQTPSARALPNGHWALPWQDFAAWLARSLQAGTPCPLGPAHTV